MITTHRISGAELSRQVVSLLQIKVSPDIDDYFFSSPLTHTTMSTYPDTFMLLMKAKADPNRVDAKHKTMLEKVRRSSNKATVAVLLAAKADPNPFCVRYDNDCEYAVVQMLASAKARLDNVPATDWQHRNNMMEAILTRKTQWQL
jgi:hypothetical protein